MFFNRTLIIFSMIVIIIFTKSLNFINAKSNYVF